MPLSLFLSSKKKKLINKKKVKLDIEVNKGL